ncbi:MAG: CapA family protein, partial [Odoribacteraceae bacterium]|nr:CapA family protein [Odoribacteraceae bacterium]
HIGIDAAVLANNHILDAGKQGVTTTLALLDSAGIRHTGVFTNSLQFIREHPLVLRARGLTFALFNYTYGTNGIPTPDGTRVNRLDSLAIARDIALVDRDKVDAVIVFFHWGDEYARLPDARQRALAELCHLHGAEIVVGSHPHVIQPLVATENRVTVYSLGNLVSNQRERYRDGGIIVTLDVTKEKNRPLSIQTAYTPVWVKLPDYSPLPPPVADTMAMSDTERRAYQQFIADTRQLLSPATNH